MRIRVVDFETSDMPPEGGIVQIGWVDVRTYANDPPEIGDPQSIFVNCGKPISITAMAVHHIRQKDIEDAVPVEMGLQELTRGGPDVFCAHNAAFERAFFQGGDMPWLCTLKAGRRIWPDAPSHSNQALRYFLGIDDMEKFEPWLAMPPHRSAPDAYVTGWILSEAIKHASIDEMIEWTGQPSILPGAIRFGKHKGILWSKVDPSYLDWIATKATEMDPDTVFTAKHWLARHRADAR